ncbi:MAG: hypothetical protein O7G86_08755 [Gammaproteobacteria bacterium]|nr:hypothetical protein [Gammaproteobacteria bacterium]
MNRSPLSHGLDGESLQTDVMRFMAIIAFCLIAILSLVRNVESQRTSVMEVMENSQPQTASAEVPVNKPISSPKPLAQQLRPTVAPLDTLPEPTPQQAPESVLTEETPRLELAQTEMPETKPQPEPETIEATSIIEDPEPQGLILRFVSDGDFLRLIAKGDVQVYAYQEHEFLALGQNYQFYEAPAPKQVYEVLQDTIPSLIDAALEKRNPSTTSFKWGISLPQRVERQIQHYLNTVSAGQLLIDRYGEVHHVASR